MVRLATYIKPERYELVLRPNLEDFTFSGEETIYFDLERPVSEITLHADELKLESAVCTEAPSGQKIEAKEISYNKEAETVTFIFPKVLERGSGKLHLKFKGVLNDKMRGFYRSSYEAAGKKCYLATTQFEATDARRAFPCIDEPAVKAVFDVTLIVPGHCEAISNTIPEEVVEHEARFKVVKFAPTPKMSTYLVAFVVGDFEFIEDKTEEGVLVRVFTTPGKKEQARFALDVAKRTLSFYNRYFDIPYPLPVLDLIAIPDFASGAMENWGAVTYKESAILVDPEHSSTHNKQWVAVVIAHELAHQWFGNLVTMEWWTHLWLNEGFASYIEYLAVDHLFPEWDIWTQFASSDLSLALKLDALKTTHPIEVEVHHPHEIDEIFDKISYSKGASIIRMLTLYLGEESFREGLRHYLRKHSYANASTDDLWLALERVSHKPVKQIMQQWTKQAGYPLVTVNERGDQLELRQSRFFSSAISRQENKDKTTWRIPVSILKSDSPGFEHFVMSEESMLLPAVKSREWLKLNAGEGGFFRVRYPNSLLRSLRKPIEDKKFGPRDRLGLIRDVFALAESRELSTVEALELTSAYKSEDDYTVWVQLASNLGILHSLIAPEAFRDAFNSFARDIFALIVRKLGWEVQRDEKHTDTLLRSLVLYNHGTYGGRETIQTAQGLFQRTTIDGISIHPDLRGTVYRLVAENGDRKEYERLLGMHSKAKLQEEKNRIEGALTHFGDPTLLREALHFSISSEVRFQDTVRIVSNVFANPDGRDLAWDFVKENWPLFRERYGHGGRMLAGLVEAMDVFTVTQKAEEIHSFFKENPVPQASRTIEQTLEKIRSNALWLEENRKEIADWLINRK